MLHMCNNLAELQRNCCILMQLHLECMATPLNFRVTKPFRVAALGYFTPNLLESSKPNTSLIEVHLNSKPISPFSKTHYSFVWLYVYSKDSKVSKLHTTVPVKCWKKNGYTMYSIKFQHIYRSWKICSFFITKHLISVNHYLPWFGEIHQCF